MIRMRALLVVTAVVMAACTVGSDGPEAEPSASSASPECASEFDGALSAWAEAGFSGSVAISTSGEFDCVAGYGTAERVTETPNTADTVFSIGSISKAFTAAAVFDLVDAGKLSLGDRAGQLLPDLVGPVAGVSIEQLLLHTSGLTGSHGADDKPLGHDEAVTAIGALELALEPGSGYLYSNAGYTLLALIVEEVSGISFREYLATQILPLPDGRVAGGFWSGEPAAPTPRAVGYFDDGTAGESGGFTGPFWATDGNGSLAMTTRDLASWTFALFTGEVVSPELADVIGSPGFDHGDGTSETPGWVRFDESIFGEPVLASAGGGGDVGHNAVVAWLPQSERVIAAASNSPDVSAEALLEVIAPSLVEGEPLPRPSTTGADPAELQSAAGRYDLESGAAFEVTASNDHLEIVATGVDAVAALFPLPDPFTREDVRAHEDNLSALLAGETREGRQERATLESDVGSIDHIEFLGTVADDGELRTYVTVTSGTDSITLWYALDDEGGIAGAQGPADPPTLVVARSGDGYRPVDPRDPDVTIVFDDAGMTVSSPEGATAARVAP